MPDGLKVQIGKAWWHRRHEGDHYYYVLCVLYRHFRIELAGVGWNDASKDGGWAIEQIGYTVPLKNGYGTVDGERYETAAEARDNAEKLLRRILGKI